METSPSVYSLKRPQGARVPLLLSVPHSGVGFPEDLKPLFYPEFIQHPKDTDWFVDQLYDFASEMGVTIIAANYSRYVIDLNRNPESVGLYGDGRKETSLVPLNTFSGEPLYPEFVISPEAVEGRKQLYYDPYYQRINDELLDLKSDFPHVLFFDAHSIKRQVTTIRPEPFPSLILGNQDEKTAHPRLIKKALKALNGGPFDVAHNHPFKGGQLTRFFGSPENGISALQLEMCQDIYMNETNDEYLPEQAATVKTLLKELFTHLISELRELK